MQEPNPPSSSSNANPEDPSGGPSAVRDPVAPATEPLGERAVAAPGTSSDPKSDAGAESGPETTSPKPSQASEAVPGLAEASSVPVAAPEAGKPASSADTASVPSGEAAGTPGGTPPAEAITASPSPPPPPEPPPPGTALYLPPKKTARTAAKPAAPPTGKSAATPPAKPTRFRTLVKVILVLAVLWSPWGYQWMTLHLAWGQFAALIDPGNARPLTPTILYQLKPSPALKKKLPELVSTPFASTASGSAIKVVSIGQARKAAQAHAELNPNADRQLDLFKRVTDGLAALPPTVPEPISPSALSPQLPAFEEIHDAARFWYVIARLQADRGNQRQAIWTLLGVALLGRLLDPVQVTRMPFADIGRPIIADCRKLAAAGLIEIAPTLSLPREDLQAVLDLLWKLEEGIPVATVAEQQVFFPFLVSQAMVREMAGGIRFGPQLAQVFRLFGDEQRMKPYEAIFLSQWRQALAKPWKERLPLVAAHEKAVTAWRQALQFPGPRWLAWLFQPGKARIELLLARTPTPFTGFLLLDNEGRQCLRGAGAVLAVLAFKRQFDRWPSGWPELEAWLGMKLPPDLYTSGPLGYAPPVLGGGTPLFGGLFSSSPRIFSPGPDLATGTADDLVFLPLPAGR